MTGRLDLTLFWNWLDLGRILRRKSMPRSKEYNFQTDDHDEAQNR